jgi:homoserine kinase
MYVPGRIARAVVPASTANLGPGFDSLGMALPLFAGIAIGVSEHTSIHLHGDQLGGVAKDKTNLIYQTAQAVFAKAGVTIPELEIAIESEIPLTRGLGSSAAAIVGALVAANGLIGNPLSRHELFQMATAMERHPDNVGAALFGGFVAAAWDGERAEAVRIEPPAELLVLVAIPSFELSTKTARGALPDQVSMSDAVFNLSHSSLLTAALATGRLEVLRHAMRDRLHQPYRESMIPGMAEVLRGAAAHGALGAVLSGAGPTILFLVDKRDAQQNMLEEYVVQTMAKAGVVVRTQWLVPCSEGARLYVADSGDVTAAPLSAVRRERPEVNV